MCIHSRPLDSYLIELCGAVGSMQRLACMRMFQVIGDLWVNEILEISMPPLHFKFKSSSRQEIGSWHGRAVSSPRRREPGGLGRSKPSSPTRQGPVGIDNAILKVRRRLLGNDPVIVSGYGVSPGVSHKDGCPSWRHPPPGSVVEGDRNQCLGRAS